MKKTEKEKNAILGELFEQYRGVILFSILKTLGPGNEYMAEDCLSQAFLIACQKKDDLLSREKPVVWLIATGKNCAKHFRRQAIKDRERLCSIDEHTRTLADDSGESFIEDIVYDDWIKNDVPQKLINELHPRTKQAFIAKYHQGKSNSEIAEEMNISESTVRTFLSEAKKHIEERVRSGKF